MDFWDAHTTAHRPSDDWFKFVRHAEWQNSQDIKRDFASASFLANNRVVFNIGGNKFRLVTKVDYEYQIVFARFIGTHAEYDKINAVEI